MSTPAWLKCLLEHRHSSNPSYSPRNPASIPAKRFPYIKHLRIYRSSIGGRIGRGEGYRALLIDSLFSIVANASLGLRVTCCQDSSRYFPCAADSVSLSITAGPPSPLRPTRRRNWTRPNRVPQIFRCRLHPPECEMTLPRSPVDIRPAS